VIDLPWAYLGLIGSRTKVEKFRQRLLARGVAAASLDRVHMPVGLDIGAQTPEEIAISILAELIAERRARSGAAVPSGASLREAATKPAIVAAAGQSRRMGRPKALLPGPEGQTFVRHLVGVLAAAGCSPIVVVLGPSGEQVLAAGDLAPALIAFNRDTRTEMIDSVRLGERYLPAGVESAMVTPVDAPFTTPELVRALCAAAAAAPEAAVVPVVGGRAGHPVVVPRRALYRPEAAGGLRALVESGAVRVESIPWPDERICADVNTPEDHASLFPGWTT
jgi:nicotine blue oxidoreductase